jgi:hypothetical protein
MLPRPGFRNSAIQKEPKAGTWFDDACVALDRDSVTASTEVR